MEDFNWRNPTEVVFGRGKEELIGGLLAGHGIGKVLLLYGGGSIKASGLHTRVCASLQKAGLAWVEFGGIRPNPRSADADRAIALARSEKVQAVLSVGGGSVLDSGKAIAAATACACSSWDLFDGRPIPAALPLYSIVTLSATASEMNSGFVLTNEALGLKLGMNTPHTFHRLSVMNPELTFTVSPTQTAYAATDVLAHVLESYLTAQNETPLMDRFVEGIVRTVMDITPRILKNPADYDARSEFMWAAASALNGTASRGLAGSMFANHMIEHGLSAVTDIAHGAGLAIIMPAWMKWYHNRQPRRFEAFAALMETACGQLQASPGAASNRVPAGIAAFERWLAGIGAPIRLSQAGISRDSWPRIVEAALAQGRRWKIDGLFNATAIQEILALAE